MTNATGQQAQGLARLSSSDSRAARWTRRPWPLPRLFIRMLQQAALFVVLFACRCQILQRQMLSLYTQCVIPRETIIHISVRHSLAESWALHLATVKSLARGVATVLLAFFLFSPLLSSCSHPWRPQRDGHPGRPRKRQKSQESLIGPRRTSNPLALHFTLWIIVSAPWVLAGGSTLTNATNYLRSEFWNNFRSLRFWAVAIGRLKPTAPGKDIREKRKKANMPKINLQSGDAYVFVRLSSENKEKRNERH